MYATVSEPRQRVAGPRVTGRQVVRHGRTLYLPSARNQVNGEGLGDFMDTLKNFGKGVLSITTGGIYDLNKNRFYVPFSGGQVRNFMQGMTNFSTLGLVNTDKFFNSQTMRTVGNIGAGIEAAAVAAVGASALTGGFSGAAATQAGAVTGGSGAVLPSTSSVIASPSALQSANLSYMTGIPQTAVPSSTGLFATAPITGSYASVPTVANAWGTAGAALTQPSLLSQIGSGISNFFGKIPSTLSSISQVMQAAAPIVKAVTPQQPQEMVAGSGVMMGDPNAMYGGFMPQALYNPLQGMAPGSGVLLPNGGYMQTGGGGGVMMPMGGGPEGEQLVADAGIMDHPATPYVAVVVVLGAAYYMLKKK